MCRGSLGAPTVFGIRGNHVMSVPVAAGQWSLLRFYLELLYLSAVCGSFLCGEWGGWVIEEVELSR